MQRIPLALLLVCCLPAITPSLAQDGRNDGANGVHLPDETAGIDNIAHILISTFDQVDVLALADTHQRKIDSDLRVRIVRDPEFARKARFIVVEFANTPDQPLLDRYISGQDVPPVELRQVWRNTCCGDTCIFVAWAMGGTDPSYQQLDRTLKSAGRPVLFSVTKLPFSDLASSADFLVDAFVYFGSGPDVETRVRPVR